MSIITNPLEVKKKSSKFMEPAVVLKRPASGDRVKEIQIELAKTDF
jgi:hypothetical protein